MRVSSMRFRGLLALAVGVFFALTSTPPATGYQISEVDQGFSSSYDLVAEESKHQEVAVDDEDDLGTAESQQVAAVADFDLLSAAGGHGYGHHKGHKGGFHKSKGHKGSKGFKGHKGFKGGHKGSHGKKGAKGHFGKGGKHYKGHHHKKGHHGGHKAGKKGSKGHKHGSKGHHNKGHKNKGFKNVYHKEEFGKNSKFYNDGKNHKYHGKHDHFDAYFKGHKGGHHKGGAHKGGKHHDGHGKKGFFKKGAFHDHKKGHKGSHGKKGHFGHKSSFGKKGGHHGGHGSKHHGHGHH